MLQLLPRIDILTPKTANPQETVEYINSYIDRCSCEQIGIDISYMNILDACYVTTMCASKHFIKYPEGKINWKVSSKIVRDFNKDFDLGNSSYSL